MFFSHCICLMIALSEENPTITGTSSSKPTGTIITKSDDDMVKKFENHPLAQQHVFTSGSAPACGTMASGGPWLAMGGDGGA
jgi:hypothetical protein